MDRNYGGVIWTNHALDRLRERGIKQGDAWATFRNPHQSKKGSSGNWVYYKTYKGAYKEERIEVVAKKDSKGEWVILSVWSSSVNLPKPKNFTSPHNQSFLRRLYNLIFKV